MTSTQEVRGARWKTVLPLPMLLLVGGASSLMACFDEAARARILGGLMAAFCFFAAAVLAAWTLRPLRLRLEDDGFVHDRWPGRALRVRWADIEAFSAWRHGIIVHHKPGRGPDFLWMRDVRRTNLPGGWRMSKSRVVDLLESHRTLMDDRAREEACPSTTAASSRS